MPCWHAIVVVHALSAQVNCLPKLNESTVVVELDSALCTHFQSILAHTFLPHDCLSRDTLLHQPGCQAVFREGKNGLGTNILLAHAWNIPPLSAYLVTSLTCDVAIADFDKA